MGRGSVDGTVNLGIKRKIMTIYKQYTFAVVEQVYKEFHALNKHFSDKGLGRSEWHSFIVKMLEREVAIHEPNKGTTKYRQSIALSLSKEDFELFKQAFWRVRHNGQPNSLTRNTAIEYCISRIYEEEFGKKKKPDKKNIKVIKPSHVSKDDIPFRPVAQIGCLIKLKSLDKFLRIYKKRYKQHGSKTLKNDLYTEALLLALKSFDPNKRYTYIRGDKHRKVIAFMAPKSVVERHDNALEALRSDPLNIVHNGSLLEDGIDLLWAKECKPWWRFW